MDSVYVVVNGAQEGPLSEEQLRERIAAGAVGPGSLAWRDGMADWRPLGEVEPGLFPAAAAPPPMAAPPIAAGAPRAVPSKTEFDVVKSEYWQMGKITLDPGMVTLEAGGLHYMRGNITMDAKMPSMGGFLKSKLTGESVVRPTYAGTGVIYLAPTFGEVHVMELNDEQWILDRGAFLAADAGIQVGMITNQAWSGLFGGEGMFQTSVTGRGKVFYQSDGPIETIELKGERLVVDGSFAVARSPQLEYRVERATKGLLSSMLGGEGLVSTFQGTGTVLLAPLPNHSMTILREFGGLRALIRSVRSSS